MDDDHEPDNDPGDESEPPEQSDENETGQPEESGDGDAEDTVTEPDGSAPRTSERYRDEESAPPDFAELRRRGAANRLLIEAVDEQRFYLEMAQAKILCIAREPPPDGLGLRSDAYEEFSAELGYPGKDGKTLPRLFNPYGEKVVQWVRDEQEKALARGEKYDFPSWREAYKEMQKQWEPKPATRRKNSRGSDEELQDEDDDPAVEQARLKAEIAARDATIKAAEAKARANAEILDQRIREERWKREEAEENLAQANLIIAELRAELAARPAAVSQAVVKGLEDALKPRTADVIPFPTAPTDPGPDKPKITSAPADTPKKRGRSRKKIISAGQLKITSAREIKATFDKPDPTCASVKAGLDPVWEWLDQENFEGDWIAAFRQFVVARVWAKVKDQGFQLDGEEMVFWSDGNRADPHALVWGPDRGFEVLEIWLGDDPDDDTTGGPDTPPVGPGDGTDGEAIDPSIPDDPTPETGAEASPLYKPLKAIAETAVWSGLDVTWRETSITLWSGEELYGSIWSRDRRQGTFGYSTCDEHGHGESHIGKLASSLRAAVIGLNKEYRRKSEQQAADATPETPPKPKEATGEDGDGTFPENGEAAGQT